MAQHDLLWVPSLLFLLTLTGDGCSYRSSALESPYQFWYPRTWSMPAPRFRPAKFTEATKWSQASDPRLPPRPSFATRNQVTGLRR